MVRQAFLVKIVIYVACIDKSYSIAPALSQAPTEQLNMLSGCKRSLFLVVEITRGGHIEDNVQVARPPAKSRQRCSFTLLPFEDGKQVAVPEWFDPQD